MTATCLDIEDDWTLCIARSLKWVNGSFRVFFQVKSLDIIGNARLGL